MVAPLVVEQLVKDYRVPGRPPFRAVSGVSFSIEERECFGLLGPNGAGKSTSMQCITGFYPPTSGSVSILGYDVHADPRRARAALGVCHQEDTLDTDFTVFDQMVRHASFFGIGAVEAGRKARELLAKFDLSAKIDEPVEALSGGMRRRLQVARALMAEPRLLVLDEPTTGLDPEARRVLWSIIAEFRRGNGAVLLSTHYMEEAERLCDRIAIIHRGKILDCDTPPRLIARHVGTADVAEEIRPGVRWKRPANVEDVYLKLTGIPLSADESETTAEDEEMRPPAETTGGLHR
ncbi:MAG TPA: ABC transporter ATP-binding protein [Candidatus Ozemobacteraceae bacterium]|nr:ABC transporter ATP-binding protein [Candidatus Ozemobacteraceae bacterium]